MPSGRGFLKPSNPSFDRLKSLVLPRSGNDHAGKLVERCLDLGYTLIKVLKFDFHPEEGGYACRNECCGCQEMAIVNCRIEPGLSASRIEPGFSASIVFIAHGNT
ncbi:MAG: hypothetical protein P8Y53_20775 [Pseudolabrys sp.]